MKFKLKGEDSVRYGVTFKVTVNGSVIRKKMHFMGGTEYDSKEIAVPMPVQGVVQRIPIDEEQITKFLKENQSIVVYIKEKGDKHGKEGKSKESESKE